MTRKEVIEAIHSMEEMPLGPFGTPRFEEAEELLDGFRPRVHDNLLSVWIAKAEQDTLGVLASLLAEPPKLVPESYFEEWIENLTILTGSWADRDPAAFWERIGPLLLHAETRHRALLAAIYATGDEGMEWLQPLMDDIGTLPTDDGELTLEAVCAIRTQKALQSLEKLQQSEPSDSIYGESLSHYISHVRKWV